MSGKKIIIFSALAALTVFFAGAGAGLGAVTLATRLSGRILLQVEESGRAWYVNPVDKKRYSLGTPAEAFSLMRKLSLGITNKDLNEIPVGSLTNAAPAQNTNPPSPLAQNIVKNYCADSQRNLPAGCSRLTLNSCGHFYSNKCDISLHPSCATSYSSPCWACNDPNVEYWTDGLCP